MRLLTVQVHIKFNTVIRSTCTSCTQRVDFVCSRTIRVASHKQEHSKNNSFIRDNYIEKLRSIQHFLRTPPATTAADTKFQSTVSPIID